MNTNLKKVGDLAPETLSALQTMNARTGEILREIGDLEVRKSKLVAEANRVESRRKALLREAADGLGIVEGTPWQITADGAALVAEN